MWRGDFTAHAYLYAPTYAYTSEDALDHLHRRFIPMSRIPEGALLVRPRTLHRLFRAHLCYVRTLRALGPSPRDQAVPILGCGGLWERRALWDFP